MCSKFLFAGCVLVIVGPALVAVTEVHSKGLIFREVVKIPKTAGVRAIETVHGRNEEVKDLHCTMSLCTLRSEHCPGLGNPQAKQISTEKCHTQDNKNGRMQCCYIPK